MTSQTLFTSQFLEALHTDTPAPDRAEEMMLYGQFIGSWDLKVIDHNTDGSSRESTGEVHFDMVLEGRAIQDVWIVPKREARQTSKLPTIGNRYGTTLRVYDPNIKAWHILWLNPITQTYNTMVGRKVKDEIVQEYRDEEGALCQWVFSETTPNSFHWIGRSSHDEGKTWLVETEFFAQRRQNSHE
ncbi:MAG TPA: hypothetical protein VLV18_00380 [Terriglobales bacterium]|nr:hypothetical protein [Terriglobales bacterium]